MFSNVSSKNPDSEDLSKIDLHQNIIKRACNRCRSKKVKCIKVPGMSNCKGCLKHDLVCTYLKSTENSTDKSQVQFRWKHKTTQADIANEIATSTSTSTSSKPLQRHTTFPMVNQGHTPKFAKTLPTKLLPLERNSTEANPQLINGINLSDNQSLFDFFFENLTYMSDMMIREKFEFNFARRIPITMILADAILSQIYLALNQPERAEKCYKKAIEDKNKMFARDIFSSGTFHSISTIQAVIVISDYELKSGKWAKAGLTFAEGLMLSHMRGLYTLDVYNPFALNRRQEEEYLESGDESAGFPIWMLLEESRRTFFKVFCFEKYFTLYKGIAQTIPLGRVLTRLPNGLDLNQIDKRINVDEVEELVYKDKYSPFIDEILDNIKRGEFIKDLSPLAVHVLLLSTVSGASDWIREICISRENLTEQKLNSFIVKLNEFTMQVDFMCLNYKEQLDLYNRLGDLVGKVTKLKLLHAIIFVITKLLEKNPNEFTANMDDIYLEIKQKCVESTISIIHSFDQIDIGRLITYNPFYFLVLHLAMKSAIQLCVISKQTNQKHMDSSSIYHLFMEVTNVISSVEKMHETPKLMHTLISYYNLRLDSFFKNPHDNVFFEDILMME